MTLRVGRHSERRILKVSGFLAPYDPSRFPEDALYEDTIVSVLGAPMDGWTPELVYRYEIYAPLGLIVNWAIMLNARPAEDASAPRRLVERVDLCHSEIHVHRFRRTSDPDDNLGERSTIASLHTGDEATVNDEWERQMALISREWPERMRRWLDG